jgi:hypothetical protein
MGEQFLCDVACTDTGSRLRGAAAIGAGAGSVWAGDIASTGSFTAANQR